MVVRFSPCLKIGLGGRIFNLFYVQASTYQQKLFTPVHMQMGIALAPAGQGGGGCVQDKEKLELGD